MQGAYFIASLCIKYWPGARSTKRKYENRSETKTPLRLQLYTEKVDLAGLTTLTEA